MSAKAPMNKRKKISQHIRLFKKFVLYCMNSLVTFYTIVFSKYYELFIENLAVFSSIFVCICVKHCKAIIFLFPKSFYLVSQNIKEKVFYILHKTGQNCHKAIPTTLLPAISSHFKQFPAIPAPCTTLSIHFNPFQKLT